MSGMRTCYLSLGSNLGDRAALLAEAVARLCAHPALTVTQVSPVYETRAVADEPQPDYLNLAVALETDLEPRQLLSVTQEIERVLGRERPYPNAPRTIDVDLLVCGGIMMATAELTLPHPRMLQRQFVLQPLADIAPDLRAGMAPPVGELADRSDAAVRRVGELAELVGRDRQ
jgi:2-amino-4-hydroxy-6-hydroxymethyldihydropteridine diphosphokinase